MTDKTNKFISGLSSLLTIGKELAVTKLLDEVIFPLYEARTGATSPNKTIRRRVADHIEAALSRTVWILNQHTVEDEAFPTKFLVGRVFPQSQATGSYSLQVSVFKQGQPSVIETIPLEEFMQNFIPHEELSFDDYNS